MPIQTLDGHPAVNDVLAPVVAAGGVPAKVLAVMLDNLSSPVEREVNLAEGLYAVARTADPGPLKTAAAAAAGALALFVTANRFHALGQTDRGLKMANACRRLNGETVDQAEADDPAYDPTWLA